MWENVLILGGSGTNKTNLKQDWFAGFEIEGDVCELHKGTK